MNIATIWLVSGIIGVGLELILPGFIVIFFGCGALFTGVAKLIFESLSTEAQLVIFVVSSIVLLLVFRKMLKKRFFEKKIESTDELADEYIGKQAVALTDFENSRGEVEFKGSKWDANSSDTIHKGDNVIIVNRKSIKLTVEKENKE